MDRGLKGKDMVPTDTISHIAGHGSLQLMRELCSLFAFVSLYQACVCIRKRGLAICVNMGLCVCFWPRADAQMKVSGEELPSNEKRRYEASLD